MGLTLSVVGMCYGNAPYIIEALESIDSSRAEIVDWVVVDDGSPDPTNRTVLENWAEKNERDVQLMLFEENRGIPVRLNQVRKSLLGDYAIFIGDDVFAPGAIEKLMEAAASYDFPDVVTGVAQWFNEDLTASMGAYWGILGAEGEYPMEVSAGSLRGRMMAGNFVSAPSTLWRLDFLEACGGYDEHYIFEDWPLLMKICSRHPEARFLFLSDVLVKYRRLNPSNAAISPARQVWREKMAVDRVLLRLEFGNSRLRTDREVGYRELAKMRWHSGADKSRALSHPLVVYWFPVSRFWAYSSKGQIYALGPLIAHFEGVVMRLWSRLFGSS